MASWVTVTTHRHSPTLISFDFGAEMATIACGVHHSLVFTKTGSIFIWGDTGYGQLGFGDTTNRNIPHLLKTSFTPKIFNLKDFHPQFKKTQKFSLHHLLESKIHTDLEIFGKEFHRCVIHSRCPKFLEVDLSPFPKSVISSTIDFFLFQLHGILLHRFPLPNPPRGLVVTRFNEVIPGP
jgi:hypothetical protein